jgi:hypothetical protein
LAGKPCCFLRWLHGDEYARLKQRHVEGLQAVDFEEAREETGELYCFLRWLHGEIKRERRRIHHWFPPAASTTNRGKRRINRFRNSEILSLLQARIFIGDKPRGFICRSQLKIPRLAPFQIANALAIACLILKYLHAWNSIAF